MLRTLAIVSNQIVLSFGVLIAFWSPKQSKNEGELYIVHGKAFGSSNSWRTKLWSSIALCQSRSKNARRGSKEKSAMKHSWWQSCQPLLEHFLESNLCMLYVVLKLRKSTIQCFKRCTIQSWNEGVTTIARQSLQAEGRILHSVMKSPFCCEMISQPFCTVLWIFPWSFSARWKPNTANWKTTSHRCEISRLLRSDFAALFVRLRISQTSFSPAKWSLVLPDICDRHFWIFCFRFLMSKSPFSPCNPPIIGFLSY